MPRFLLLRHEMPPDRVLPSHSLSSHWDFMLEAEGALLCWRLHQIPASSGEVLQVERLADHRLAYLDYEGPVSGGRGTVRCLDTGTFRWVEQTPYRLRLELDGNVLAGTLELTQIDGSDWAWHRTITTS